jgi:transcriptional regulator with GAF, ATPase, and Fis domain
MTDHAPTTMEVYPTCTVVSALPESGLKLRDEMQRYQEWLVNQALIRTNGNRAQAARLLGLKRTTLVMMLQSAAKRVPNRVND